jgi:hypothetical protein
VSLSSALPLELQELISGAAITTSFVVDATGSPVGPSGNSSGIGNKTDLSLLRHVRAHSEIVLTSGKTARADSISMPKTAHLAILTAAGVDSLALKPTSDQRLILIGPHQAAGYSEALAFLKTLGYSSIQVEFGVTGLNAILEELDLCVISGRDSTGVKLFLEEHAINQSAWFELEDLFVALGSGRGKG